jgi:4-methyl-5(b-hydroxyethyl)-thiazole monophosphate biosynthesis
VKAFLFLADGFEEIEAITPIDILRRAEIDIETISISNKNEVIGAHKIKLLADKLFSETNFSECDILILPGGIPGTKNLEAHQGLKSLLEKHYNQGKSIAAICAAPSILGGLGILNGKDATCYPGFEHTLIGAQLSKNNVVKSGKIITAKGAGTALEFSLKIVEELKGSSLADKITTTICANSN